MAGQVPNCPKCGSRPTVRYGKWGDGLQILCSSYECTLGFGFWRSRDEWESLVRVISGGAR